MVLCAFEAFTISVEVFLSYAHGRAVGALEFDIVQRMSPVLVERQAEETKY